MAPLYGILTQHCPILCYVSDTSTLCIRLNLHHHHLFWRRYFCKHCWHIKSLPSYMWFIWRKRLHRQQHFWAASCLRYNSTRHFWINVNSIFQFNLIQIIYLIQPPMNIFDLPFIIWLNFYGSILLVINYSIWLSLPL